MFWFSSKKSDASSDDSFQSKDSKENSLDDFPEEDESELPLFARSPPPLPRSMVRDLSRSPLRTPFQLRGPSYLTDRVKVPVSLSPPQTRQTQSQTQSQTHPQHQAHQAPAQHQTHQSHQSHARSPLLPLLCADLFLSPQTTNSDFSNNPDGRSSRFLASTHPSLRLSQSMARGDEDRCPVLVINFTLPGPPQRNLVLYFRDDFGLTSTSTSSGVEKEGEKHRGKEVEKEVEKKVEREQLPPHFSSLARQFFHGSSSSNNSHNKGNKDADDEFRSSRLKLIPRIVSGSMLRMIVKETPALIGNKLKVEYFKGDNFFEISVDLCSNSSSAYLAGLGLSLSASVCVDLAFCLEAREIDHLPELLLAGCCCHYLDCALALSID